LVSLSFVLSLASFAQSVNSSILGRVLDPSGASISGAKVVATNAATNITFEGTSDDEGRFRFPIIPPGTYDVAAEKSGFTKYVQKGILLELNQRADLNIELKVSSTSEVVNVSGEIALINTTSAEVGVNMDSRRLMELPVAPNRNILNVALQVPGVSQLSSGNSSFSSGGVSFSVNGMRTRSNNFMLDGADSNNSSVTGLVQEINNPDLIAEFRIITNQFLPEYGRAAGSVVNIITKGGTNSLHGSAYWTYNSNRLNSRSNLDERVFPRAPWRVENQFAGTLGGPVIKNKTFLFGSILRWTDRRFASGSSITGAPTEAGRQALQSISANRPQVRALLNNLPAAQIPSNQSFTVNADGRQVAIPYGTLAGAASNTLDVWQWSGRVDHRFNDKHSFMSRIMYDDRVEISGQSVPPGLTSNVPARRQAYLGNLTSTLSPTTFNEMRFNFQRLRSQSNATDPNAITIPNIEINQLGLTGFNAAAARTAIGLAVNLPQAQITNNYQFSNNLTLLKDSHSFKFGIDFRRAEQFQDFNPTLRGRLNYETLQQFVDDAAAVQSINVLQAGLPTFQAYRYYDYFFFAQDEWRATSRMTLTYGIRYETPGNPFNWLRDLNATVVANNNNNPGFRIDDMPGRQHNWMPRVGFNYRFGQGKGPLSWLTGNEKLVIRGGFSRTYDAVFNNILLNIYSAWPFTQVEQRPAGTPGAFTYIDGIRAGTARPPAPTNPLLVTRTIVDSSFRSPLAEQFSLNMQRDLGNGTILSTGWIATKGTALFQTVDGNPTVPGSNGATRVNPSRGIIRLRANSGSSIYHSWQTSLERRFSRNFQLSAHYTWSSFIDDQSEIFNASVAGEVAIAQDSFNRRADRSRSTYDRPHRFTVNGLWELPYKGASNAVVKGIFGGWKVGGFLTFQSGAPFSALNGVDPGRRLSGIDTLVGNAIRPNVNTNLPVSQLSVEELFRYGSFTSGFFNLFSPVTAASPLGNAGRNLLRADGIGNLDLNLGKEFAVREGHKLQFRGEFYNITNSRDFGIPEARANNAGFANQWNTNGGNRRIVMLLRYSF
jgi:hypothetical protein